MSTAKRDAAALHLAQGRSVKAAARLTDIGERTLHRWLDEPDFVDLVQQQRTRLFDTATGRLTGLTRRATARLRQLLASRSEKVALGACKAVLAECLRCREQLDLARQIGELRDEVSKLKAAAGGKPRLMR